MFLLSMSAVLYCPLWHLLIDMNYFVINQRTFFASSPSKLQMKDEKEEEAILLAADSVWGEFLTSRQLV